MGRSQRKLIIDDLSAHRKQERKALETCQIRNRQKVPVRMDAKTTLYVYPEQVDKVLKQKRLDEANHKRNAGKRAYLESKGWVLRADGLWANRYGFLIKEMEAASEVAGYYEWLKNNQK